MVAKKRQMTVTVEGTSGSIGHFYVFVDHERVINKRGSKKRTWKGKVGAKAAVKIRVTGVDDATYKLKIDLPGDKNDVSVNRTLDGGYDEWKATV